MFDENNGNVWVPKACGCSGDDMFFDAEFLYDTCDSVIVNAPERFAERRNQAPNNNVGKFSICVVI